jgi:hypothetical protein
MFNLKSLAEQIEAMPFNELAVNFLYRLQKGENLSAIKSDTLHALIDNLELVLVNRYCQNYSEQSLESFHDYD